MSFGPRPAKKAEPDRLLFRTDRRVSQRRCGSPFHDTVCDEGWVKMMFFKHLRCVDVDTYTYLWFTILFA